PADRVPFEVDGVAGGGQGERPSGRVVDPRAGRTRRSHPRDTAPQRVIPREHRASVDGFGEHAAERIALAGQFRVRAYRVHEPAHRVVLESGHGFGPVAGSGTVLDHVSEVVTAVAHVLAQPGDG